jgi:hypothetical protein
LKEPHGAVARAGFDADPKLLRCGFEIQILVKSAIVIEDTRENFAAFVAGRNSDIAPQPTRLLGFDAQLGINRPVRALRPRLFYL